jgi:hypothetical protein
MTTFWNVSPCLLIALVVDAVRISETSIYFCNTKPNDILEHSNFYPHHRENLSVTKTQ